MKQRVEPGISQASSDSRVPESGERKRPPPLPAECNLEQDKEIRAQSPPPISEVSATAVEGSESKRQEVPVDPRWSSVQERFRTRRSNTKVRSASWVSSLGLHAAALLLLALILAPADFGGTGIHSLVLSLSDESQSTQLVELETSELELPPAGAEDSNANPMQTELARIAGTGGGRSVASGLADGARGSFFGIDASGHEFVYVLDMSGSMEGRRFSRATAELIRSVDQLTANQSFYVLLFSSHTVQMFGTSSYLPQSMKATAENKERLASWLGTAFEGGGTDPREALQVAMRMNPSAIFMLSDGEFNGRKNQMQDNLLGRNADTFAMVEAISTKPPIHAVAFEDQASQENMKRLANLTNGDFRFIDKKSRTDPNESIKQVRQAMDKGDLATAALFLQEFSGSIDAASDEVAMEAKAEVGKILLENALLGLKNDQFDTAKIALFELANLDPKAQHTDAIQQDLSRELLAHFAKKSEIEPKTDLENMLTEFVKEYPRTEFAKQIRPPLVQSELDKARELFANGQTLESLEKLEDSLANYSDSASVAKCREELDRIGDRVLKDTMRIRKEQGGAVAVKQLRRLVAAFKGTKYQKKFNQALEREAKHLLIAARDAQANQDSQLAKQIEEEIEEGFGKDALLTRLRSDILQRERRAQAVLNRGLRFERMYQGATALGQYQLLLRDYEGTLAAEKAKARIQVLQRFNVR